MIQTAQLYHCLNISPFIQNQRQFKGNTEPPNQPPSIQNDSNAKTVIIYVNTDIFSREILLSSSHNYKLHE